MQLEFGLDESSISRVGIGFEAIQSGTGSVFGDVWHRLVDGFFFAVGIVGSQLTDALYTDPPPCWMVFNPILHFTYYLNVI